MSRRRYITGGRDWSYGFTTKNIKSQQKPERQSHFLNIWNEYGPADIQTILFTSDVLEKLAFCEATKYISAPYGGPRKFL